MRRRWGWLLALAAVATVAMPSDAPPAEAQSAEVAGALASASAIYGVPYARLSCLAYRESRYAPGAYNRAGYHGLMQFDWPTWSYGARLAGYAGASPYEPRAAAHVAAFLIARGEGRRWPPLRYCP